MYAFCCFEILLRFITNECKKCKYLGGKYFILDETVKFSTKNI